MNSIAIFVALTAITTQLIQTYVPSTEVNFVSCVCAFCLLFGAAVADPEAFFGVLFSVAPQTKKWLPSVVRSIEYLREGEERVATLENENKKDSLEDGLLVSSQKLLDEIRKRIQWKFILASAVCGLGVKYIAWEKPKVIGRMLDSIVQEGIYIHFKIRTSFHTSMAHSVRTCNFFVSYCYRCFDGNGILAKLSSIGHLCHSGLYTSLNARILQVWCSASIS